MWIVALLVASVALWRIEELEERVSDLEWQLDGEPE
jgi:hypothetical protein